MTMDNPVVVPGAVPPEGAASPEGGTPPAVVTPPAPTPEEVLNQKIAEAVSKALAVETEKARREIQSAKDKATAEVAAAQRRARLAENTMSATRTHLQGIDTEVAKEMELAELRAKEQGRLAMEQEEQATRYQMETVQKFHDQMTQFITGLGLNPTDQRIDWAGDAPDLLTVQRRVLDSVTKIQKESVKTLEASLDTKIKEAEKRIKKELNIEDVNSVSAQMSGGVTGEGIPTDMTRFRKWVSELPQTEYEKHADKINQMLREGKIK